MNKQTMMNMIPDIENALLGIHCQPIELTKDGENLFGLTAMYGNVNPTMYFNELPDDISPVTIAQRFDNAINCFHFDENLMTSKDYILNHVMYGLVMADFRDELNDRGIYTEDYYGMVKYYHVIVGEDDDTRASFKITSKFLDSVGITISELNNHADENMHADMYLETITNVISSLMPTYTDVPDCNVYVLTNTSKVKGASMICSLPILKEISYENKTDFFIIPSSIHEVLIVPNVGGDDQAAKLREMVEIVNDTTVEYKERLSYDVFYFDGSKLMIA